jgi:hypothetical protein
MDIVEKLRFHVTGRYDIDAAADEIERLRATVDDLAKENWRFRRALERIVDREEEIDPKSYAELVLMGEKE